MRLRCCIAHFAVGVSAGICLLALVILLTASRFAWHFAGLLHSIVLCIVLRIFAVWNLSAHQYRHCLGVHLGKHIAKEVKRLGLVDYQRVFLLVACVLHRLTQLVEFAQMHLPCFVDGHQEHHLFPRFRYRLTFAVDSLTEIASDAIDAAAVGDRHSHKAFSAVLGCDSRYHRHRHLCQAFLLVIECFHHLFVEQIDTFLCVELAIFFGAERHIDGKCGHHVHLEFIVVAVAFHHIFHGALQHFHNVETHTLAHKCVVAAGVYHITLHIHHVVVFEQVLTHTEVVLFHAFLCVLY